jgi:glycosyl hydrolase family 115
MGGSGLAWRTIPHLGRASGAVTAFPQGRGPTTQHDGVRLEYDVHVSTARDLTVHLHLVPTLDVSGERALRIGVSVDEEAMRILTDRLVPAAGEPLTQEMRDWNQTVADNARMVQATFPRIAAGKHVIKIWRLDDNVVLQKVIVD